MRVAAGDPNGTIDSDTRFRFSQDGEIVSARYEGGAVRLGVLVGSVRDSDLRFRYVQLDRSGELHSGRSSGGLVAEPGRPLRLIERFTWESRTGSGTNTLEQVP